MDSETLYGLFNAEPEVEIRPGTGPYGGDVPRPRYNIAPTTDNPVVRVRAVGDEPPQRRIELLRWGLVPSWAKDPSVGNRMFNARAESVLDKPAFRTALRKRRCLVPASGYFEWQKTGIVAEKGTRNGKGKVSKQPFYITPADGSVMAFAGLWEYWRPRATDDAEAGDPIVSYTILTTEPVGVMADIHDRMPLIVPAEEWDTWLDMDLSGDEVAGLLVPPRPELIEALELRPVDPRVGNVNNDDAALLDRLTEGADREEEQLGLPLG